MQVPAIDVIDRFPVWLLTEDFRIEKPQEDFWEQWDENRRRHWHPVGRSKHLSKNTDVEGLVKSSVRSELLELVREKTDKERILRIRELAEILKDPQLVGELYEKLVYARVYGNNIFAEAAVNDWMVIGVFFREIQTLRNAIEGKVIYRGLLHSLLMKAYWFRYVIPGGSEVDRAWERIETLLRFKEELEKTKTAKGAGKRVAELKKEYRERVSKHLLDLLKVRNLKNSLVFEAIQEELEKLQREFLTRYEALEAVKKSPKVEAVRKLFDPDTFLRLSDIFSQFNKELKFQASANISWQYHSGILYNLHYLAVVDLIGEKKEDKEIWVAECKFNIGRGIWRAIKQIMFPSIIFLHNGYRVNALLFSPVLKEGYLHFKPEQFLTKDTGEFLQKAIEAIFRKR